MSWATRVLKKKKNLIVSTNTRYTARVPRCYPVSTPATLYKIMTVPDAFSEKRNVWLSFVLNNNIVRAGNGEKNKHSRPFITLHNTLYCIMQSDGHLTDGSRARLITRPWSCSSQRGGFSSRPGKNICRAR